ncbi:MAG: sigma-54-dependent Fis family transcriptional regulator [Gammaproteobacteria bacterium]|nr:sigma-54-dependent Fis family transcriptional regulator [Gammaproteobacteria bacterium]
MTRVLVIERDDSSRRQLREEFERNGFGVVEASSAEALSLGSLQADTVVANAAFAGAPSNAIAMAAPIPVVVVADSPSIPEAVECMRAGAADYLAKPFEANDLVAAVERAVAMGSVPTDSSAFSPIIGQCEEMRALLDQVASVAPTESSILILGESGTGKELIARAVHSASRRHHAQVMTFNCAAVPETFVEVELFGSDSGHSATEENATATRRGLLEVAHGGTLFLDEIGDLPPAAQARLFHYLSEGTVRRLGSAETHCVDVRIIAATHRDLRQLTDNGRFRKDLFTRLSMVCLRVPPLRERGDDVIAIAQTTLERVAGKFNKRGLTLTTDAIDAMRRYRWPGNVRELENALERAVILCQATTIDADILPIDTESRRFPQPDAQRETSSSLEGYFLRFVLDNEDHLTETELAKELGISRKSLWERRQRLNIPRRRTRKRGPRR